MKTLSNPASSQNLAFDFGKNWAEFSGRHLDAARFDQAVVSLQKVFQTQTFKDLTFLDLGCGSGLFTLAAVRLNAAHALGVDVNPACIQTSETNRTRLGIPQDRVSFTQGSVLDKTFMQRLGKYDCVYAWGSLHHTGAMHEALRQAAACVAGGGKFVVAIYNRHWSSALWKMIKRVYNQSPGWFQRFMIGVFVPVIYTAKALVSKQNPLKKDRGMDFYYDVVDWVGGYPYEYASKEEIVNFVESLGFKLQEFWPASAPTGCHEYCFQKTN